MDFFGKDFKEGVKALIKEALKELLDAQVIKHPKKKDDWDLITVEEAATLLRLSPKTIQCKAHKKEIPHYKQDGQLYFDRKELEQRIRKNRRGDADFHDQRLSELEEEFKSL